MPKRALSFIACLLFVASACRQTDRVRIDVASDATPPLAGPGFTSSDDGGAPLAVPSSDPETCEEAVKARSYVGCDYWPTVTSNNVEDMFDFAVVVSNLGRVQAKVTVTGPNATKQVADIAPGALKVLWLPWVDELKGPAASVKYPGGALASALKRGGAYHLVSDRPVVAVQFNPLEFAGKGGPPGKTWPSCGEEICGSYSNDASLLIPSSAMTGTYRAMGIFGVTHAMPLGAGSFMTITATRDATNVEVDLAASAHVLAGDGVPAAGPGEKMRFTLDAGDVAQLVMRPRHDVEPSGSLVRADQPIQLITGHPCISLPASHGFCDHLEEVVPPAETMGSHYVVMHPTGPRGTRVKHLVRFYGNVDGTTLAYTPSRPASCPEVLAAGQVVACDLSDADFVVRGDHAFGVGTFTLSSTFLDPAAADDEFAGESLPGDPAQSFVVAVEQYRDRYVFLAPDDYEDSFVDVIAPKGATVALDGDDRTSALRDIPGTDFRGASLRLEAREGGVHTLTSSAPVSVQVLGYATTTGYAYPGGLNLGLIAPAPLR